MNWKLLVLFLGIGVFASCGGGPKDDAEKVCDCGNGIITMLNDNASENDVEAKWKECDELFDQLEDKYKDDEEKLKEFNEAGEACSEKLEEEMDAAMEKWEAAQEGGEE
ncbi:MAG: hypothetical protein A2W93_06955 [Bacteroidetes bacterium GWF2_43_63]|nr:MAG: hypothetical protein A2W94_09925 [Bacteroidetes bacterium GWE2_42_42]OFY53753.1 MAG: hypothetical protein A2W93_06955 [Bacteroidetes bacterium GWF2_43_63]HCB61034.1 hypothetical protein [Bacteroidales bacterium]HCY24156.1 hypothetical protein [Bacteroidales bacterium]